MILDRREFLGKMLTVSTAAALAPSILDMFNVGIIPEAGAATLSDEETMAILAKALSRGGDFSELYYEAVNSLSLSRSEGVFSEAIVGFSEGTGIRAVDGIKNGYAYVNGNDNLKLLEAADTAAFIASSGNTAKVAHPVNQMSNGTVKVKIPLGSIPESRKMELIMEAEDAARGYNPNIKQVDITYYDEVKRRVIVNSEGLQIENELPLIWVVIEVLAEKDGIRHQGRSRISAHQGFEFFDTNSMVDAAKEASREALVMLSAKPSPSGVMPVVIDRGWGGVMIHEAVGHGLEADFIYKGTSIYADKLDKKIGSELVTMVDDSSWPNARGTTEFDDEGTAGKRNVLIEDGVVRSFMHDKISARKLNLPLSGNGRRESYRYYPIPRMTNTFLDNGTSNAGDIIASTPKGVFIKGLSGGSVDTISGQFNFIVREAYLIEDGKVTSPISGATLIGRGIDVLTNIDAIANDLDIGSGFCGKDQWVPVTAGLPTVRISNGMTVGGSE
jgi:TldD protein